MKTNNTHNSGTATVFFYQKGKKYIGVCLQFDLVDEDTDLDQLKVRMKEKVDSYIKYVCSNKKDVKLLNRPAPDVYWKEFFEFVHTLQELEKQIRFRTQSSKQKSVSVEMFPINGSLVKA